MNRYLSIFCYLILVFSSRTVYAQVSSDGTLNTQVFVNGNRSIINGGIQRGSNLFHGFSDFSISNQGAVLFNNELSIGNIFARVTGGKSSFIDGLIGTQGNANLYLINPNGINFGSNASFNVKGDVLISTASGIYFQDGSYFSASNTSEPLLTISLPTHLKFEGLPAKITVSGQGHSLRNTAFGFSPVTPPGVPLPSVVLTHGRLGLVGGDIVIDGGGILALNNSINLAAVKHGNLGLAMSSNGWSFDFSKTLLGSINLKNRALVGVMSFGNNAITINSHDFVMDSGSVIFLQNIGNNADTGINITTNNVSVLGHEHNIPTLIVSEAFGRGKGGSLILNTERLNMGINTELRTQAYLQANGGDVTFNAKHIHIESQELSRRYSHVITSNLGYGKGGDILINSDSLSMFNGANINAYTFSNGDGGRLTINTRNILVSGFNDALVFNGLFSNDTVERFSNYSSLSTVTFGKGRAGNIKVDSQNTIIEGGGKLVSLTFSSGNTGHLDGRIENLKVRGYTTYNNFPSQFYLFSYGTGNTGNLTLFSKSIEVTEGANMGIVSLVSGDTGNATINANDIRLDGTNLNFIPSVINVATFGSGNSGNLEINAQRIRVENGGRIDTAALASGDAGDLLINASESLYISGKVEGSINTSLIDASTRSLDPVLASLFNLPDYPSGFSGNLTINTPLLVVDNGATISVENGGFGNAGSLIVNTNELRLLNGGNISASSFSGEGGNIFINSNFIISDQGLITASSRNLGNSGNISINSSALILNRRSRISAGANIGNGGNIQINSPILFVSGDSVLNASSNLGIDGQVIVDSQIFNPETPTLTIAPNFVLPTQSVVSQCLVLPDSIIRLQPAESSEMLSGMNLPIISSLGEDISYQPVLLEKEGSYFVGGLTSSCPPN